KDRTRKHSKVARAKLRQLYETMGRLLPQIRYWHRTSFVAKNKVVSLHIPELYSIVRGKIGKTVEFGLNWGIARLRGGYLLATLAKHRNELHDHRYAMRAVEGHITLFGKPPRDYAYDRGGYSPKYVRALKELGVKNVALAPQGNAKWEVSGRTKEKLINERARVEGGIGSIKSNRYGFNRPGAKSAPMMGACGQRAVLGFNLRKMVRDLAS